MMVPAAFEQFAVRVTAELTVGDDTDDATEQLNVPGDELLQVSVLVPASNEKLEQFGSLRVNEAACEGEEAGMARRARVSAAAASVDAAARKSGRFIFDSQAERRSGGPAASCKFRASKLQ